MMLKKYLAILFVTLSVSSFAVAQGQDKDIKNVSPVYEDLTTEIGVDKGMNELNINFGYRNLKSEHHTLLTQLEYEFAPIKNLGFELLLPFTAYVPNPLSDLERPGNSIEFLQWTTQYTFFQSAEKGISLAFGLDNVLESRDPYVSPQESNKGFSVENIGYTPFLILAKNWQEKSFILFKGGTLLDHDLEEGSVDFEHQLTSAFHYQFSENSDNYLGIELNKTLEKGDFEIFIRPQIILEISDSFNLGTTVGIPAWNPETKWSAFIRLAYEF